MKHSYRQPASELPGVKTLVRPQDSVERGREIPPDLPSPPWGRSKPAPQLQFGKPGPGKNYKVPNKPGEHSPVPDPKPSTMVQRRPEVNSALDTDTAPTMRDRQHEQRGQAKMYYERYYRSNRGKIKQRMKTWYDKMKNRFDFKKDQKNRRENPDKFKRKPGGGIKQIRDRAKRDRQKKSDMVILPVARLFNIHDCEYGIMLGVDPDTCSILLFMLESYDTLEVPLDVFLTDYVMLSDADIDTAIDNLDVAFGADDPVERMALLYEKRPPDMEPGSQWGRGRSRKNIYDDQPQSPASRLPDYTVWDAAGSARVIPEHGNMDFVNNKAAARISDIRENCDDDLQSKAQDVEIRLARVDAKNSMWLFHVDGSKGQKYKVRIKVVAKKNIRDVRKADILVSCSCPFWKWQGPEYHAKKDGYLLGKPRGTASKPDQKDPKNQHGACKHILAVLDRVEDFNIPGKEKTLKKAALSYMANICKIIVVRDDQIELESFIRRYGLDGALSDEGGEYANL